MLYIYIYIRTNRSKKKKEGGIEEEGREREKERKPVGQKPRFVNVIPTGLVSLPGVADTSPERH